MPFHGTELNLVLRWTQDEVARFAKELAEFRARSAASLARCSIGGRDDAERRKLLGATGQVQQFGRDLVDTTRNQVAHDFVPSFTEFFFFIEFYRTRPGLTFVGRTLLDLRQFFSSFYDRFFFAQSGEVLSLRTDAAEVAALVEEARLRQSRRRNAHLHQLLRLRPLDPVNRRRVSSIEKVQIYLDQQVNTDV